jgi:hypothetical protein
MGIALGLTNLLMRRLVRRGWVRVRRTSPVRVHYHITAAGVAAQGRLRREWFLHSLRIYSESRARMQARLAVLARELVQDADGCADIVFYGAGHAAELAFFCLEENGLRLAGVVDSPQSKHFMGIPVQDPAELEGTSLAGRPFGRIVVMPFQNDRLVRAALSARQISDARIFWI